MMYEFHIDFPCNLMSEGETPDEAFKHLQEGWRDRVPKLQRADIKSVEDIDGNKTNLSVQQLDVSHLRGADKTVCTIFIHKDGESCVVYVLINQGRHFDVYRKLDHLLAGVDGDISSRVETFNDEDKMYNYLERDFYKT